MGAAASALLQQEAALQKCPKVSLYFAAIFAQKSSKIPIDLMS